MSNNYLDSVKKQFQYYKSLGDLSFEQLAETDIHIQLASESNAIAIIVKHIVGNQLSRFTNFRTEDGEKPWRHRDTEFEGTYESKEAMISAWNRGWNCLFESLDELTPQDLEDLVYIRNQGHTVIEALNRQLCHYAYHVGQIVFSAKLIKNKTWTSLSIPKNNSEQFNVEKFSEKKGRKHFTDE